MSYRLVVRGIGEPFAAEVALVVLLSSFSLLLGFKFSLAGGFFELVVGV